MIRYIRSRLGLKLLVSYVAVVLVGATALALTSQFMLPASFNRHMARFVAAGGAMNGPAGMGMSGAGRGFGASGGQGMMAQLYADYRASFNDALLYASVAAVSAGLVLSVVFSRSVIRPVRAMAQAAERIAEGRYDERVIVSGTDELADFTSRFNQMAAQLQQVENMRRRLIGDVSHELRTPLTTISGSAEGLIDGVLPASRETYEQIRAEAERLSHLVDDLQELSRVEAQAYRLECQSLDIGDLLARAVNRMSVASETKGITLELALTDNLPPVLADEARLMQVLTNLIGNAVRYSPGDSRVTVSAGQAGREVVVAVKDTGIGISGEHLPHVFDRFYRVDPSRAHLEGSGSGIGLTIARALVEAHGGRIWAESAGEGDGSTFTFTIPIAPG